MQEQKLELNNSYYSKEGQTQGAIGAMVTLIVGVGTAVLVLIFVGVLGGRAYEITEDRLDEIGDHAITADGFTVVNGTNVALDHPSIHTGSLSIYNSSAPLTEYGLNNFTIDYTNGKVLWTGLLGEVGSQPINNTGLAANYSYGERSIQVSIKNSIISGFEALEDTGSYLPLIVLGIIIFLILGLVLGMTALTSGGGFSGSAL